MKVREIAENLINQDGSFLQSDAAIVAKHFLDLLNVAEQASSAGFESKAANGILQAAVDCYMGNYKETK